MTAASVPAATPRPDRAQLLLVVVALYLGAFWAWSGIAKSLSPDAAYAFAAQVVGGGMPAKVVVVVSVALETALGAALLAGAIGRRAGIIVSLGLLALIDANFAAGDFHSFIGLVWLLPAFLIYLGVIWIVRNLVREDPDGADGAGTAPG